MYSFRLVSAGLGLIVLCQSLVSQAQGTFRNLDFGLSQVPASTPPGTPVAASTALPFWDLYAGPNQATTVLYNAVGLGGVGVSLLSPTDTVDGGIPGHYTVVVQAGLANGSVFSAAIAQTAQIPAGSMSLLFSSTPPNGGGWQVTVGGQQLPVVEVSQGARFNEYGLDISHFAGQVDELRFTALPGTSGANMWLGQIQFSPVAVPEPSLFASMVLGLLAVGAARKRFSSRRFQR